MTASEAIRKHCLECVCDHFSEITNCTASISVCRLWPYRMKRGFDGSRGDVRKSRLKTIRQECLLCFGSSYEGVKSCQSKNCNLYEFRFGRNGNIVKKKLTGERLVKMKGRMLALRLAKKGAVASLLPQD